MKILMLILLLPSLNVSAQIVYSRNEWGVYHPNIIDSNYHLKEDTTTYIMDVDGSFKNKYTWVVPQTNYKIIYKMVVGTRVFTDCCAALTPFGETSYVNDVNEWINSNNNVLIYRYSGLLDISGAMIYEGDILKDKTGNQHRVSFGNGCFRYGKYDNKKHQLDSILYRAAIIKDSLYLK